MRTYYVANKRNGKFMVEVTLDNSTTYDTDNLLIEVPPKTALDYWDGNDWVTPPEQPDMFHIFDYSARLWIDPRSLYERKTQKWDEIKAQRDQLEFGGFEYKDNFYDSDQVSQGRIMGAAIAGIPQTWTLANNTTVDLTAEELKELYAALQRHVATVHERGRVARYKIDVATTPQDIEAVTL